MPTISDLSSVKNITDLEAIVKVLSGKLRYSGSVSGSPEMDTSCCRHL